MIRTDQPTPLFRTAHRLRQEYATFELPLRSLGTYRHTFYLRKMAELIVNYPRRDRVLSLISAEPLLDTDEHTHLMVVDNLALLALERDIPEHGILERRLGTLVTCHELDQGIHITAQGEALPAGRWNNTNRQSQAIASINSKGQVEVDDVSHVGTWILADWTGVQKVKFDQSIVAALTDQPEAPVIPLQRKRLS